MDSPIKTVFRTVRKSHFTTVPNALARDKTISFRARGIMLLVLSNIDEWQVHQSWLSDQGTEGRDAVRSAMQELEGAGYAVFEEVRDKTGRIASCRWTFYDESRPMGDRTNRTRWRENEPKDGKPSDGKPSGGLSTHGEPAAKKNISETEEQKREDHHQQGQCEESQKEEFFPVEAVSPPKEKLREKKRFEPPTVAEVEAYMREYLASKGANASKAADKAEEFVDYHTARGWKLGARPMVDWQASVRTWHRQDLKFNPQPVAGEKKPWKSSDHL